MRKVVLASGARARLWSALGALVLICGIATPSRAELVSSIAQGATLGVAITVLDPIGITLASSVAVTAARDGGGLLTGVAFTTSVFHTTARVVDVTDPGAFPIDGIQATLANSAANFFRTGGNLGGTMPLIGVAKVCLFGECSAAVQNLDVPFSVVGGPTATTFVQGAVNLTVRGAPWTQGTAAVGASTLMGNAGDVTQMTNGASSFSNVVSLVTPVFVSTNIGASAVVPVFGTLNFTLTSAPEPGALAAIGAAIVSLVAVGFARRR